MRGNICVYLWYTIDIENRFHDNWKVDAFVNKIAHLVPVSTEEIATESWTWKFSWTTENKTHIEFNYFIQKDNCLDKPTMKTVVCDNVKCKLKYMLKLPDDKLRTRFPRQADKHALHHN